MCFFFFNDTATTEIYTLSLHDALPILLLGHVAHDALAPAHGEVDVDVRHRHALGVQEALEEQVVAQGVDVGDAQARSEEHTSELQSRQYLVCRLLLEKKNCFGVLCVYV